MKKIFELKLEEINIYNKINQENKEVNPSEKILTRCQRSMARHNAAQSIRTTYESMLKILEKDASYYDKISQELIKNQKEQSKMILKTTLMGQIAVENLDNNRKKYNKLAHEILINMIERERTLKIARQQVEDIFNAQSLMQNYNVEKKNNESYNEEEEELEKQIEILKQLFVQVKKSFNEQSNELLLSRLKEQLIKKNNLSQHLENVIKENDLLLKKKQHAQLILDAFQQTMISTKELYNSRKQEILEEIEMKKQHQRDLKISTKVEEQLLMKIRGSLQSILDFIIDEKIFTKSPNEKDVESDDVITLLDRVTRIVTLLHTLSNLNLDEKRARDFYQTYISDYKSNMKYNKENVESGKISLFIFYNLKQYVILLFFADILVDEYEIIDSNVLTRKDIKKQSKQIVETRLE
ncbi:uncharacterized protein LOC127282679 [Leptopilina boulardi]|uniref:uncharacterized protein LOC127282679 n=1 Tax=Leptopilina boulardi TaxID=63433 RepID=UPI0021F55C99|nr:uncharacterized protein LOC127282679 [Leptopilina boulardi]